MEAHDMGQITIFGTDLHDTGRWRTIPDLRIALVRDKQEIMPPGKVDGAPEIGGVSHRTLWIGR